MGHAMNAYRVLELYDQDERRDFALAGVRREVVEKVIRHVSLTGDEGFIAYSALTDADADEAIRQQISYFASLGQPFEWKHYSHDTPSDLLERLKTHNFEVGEHEALLALDLAELPRELRDPVTHDVRRLTQADELKDIILIKEEVWQRSFAGITARLERDLRERPDTLSVYVAYAAGVPASAAWTYFEKGSRFAGLWGGSTRKGYRGRGLYTALVAVRAQEALGRGVHYLTVDASPMSRPILERLGFRWLSDTRPCIWHPENEDHT